MPDECQFCGACCFSDSSVYVPLTAGEGVKLSRIAAELVCERDGASYMAMRDGHCAALTIRGSVFACSIYAQRPSVCRELDRGTPACREERILKKATAARLL